MVEIRLTKHNEEIEQLCDLFRLCFNRDMPLEVWEWQYLKNPFSSVDAEVIVALDGSKIVGARPFIYVEMWLENTKVITAQHCNTMVHPEYRGRGIFNRMGNYALQYLRENGFYLSYGFPGLMSRRGFLSQGYRIVVETEVLFRATNPQKLLHYKLNNRFLSNGLGFLYDKLLNHGIKTIPPNSGIFQVEVSDKFTDELKEVDSLRDEAAINLVRSEGYLRWRFDLHIECQYKYILVKREGELWGYAVVSVQKELNGLVYGVIVDYLVKNKDIACFRTLMSKCLDELDKSEYDIAMIWAFSETNFREELIKKFGFKSSSKFPYNRFFGYSYLDAIRTDDHMATSVNIYDKNNWRLTHAYTDTR